MNSWRFLFASEFDTYQRCDQVALPVCDQRLILQFLAFSFLSAFDRCKDFFECHVPIKNCIYTAFYRDGIQFFIEIGQIVDYFAAFLAPAGAALKKPDTLMTSTSSLIIPA